MRQGGEAVAVGAGLRRRVHGGFDHGGERARGRAREGEIDPNGSGGWRGATEGSRRPGEAGGGSTRERARRAHALPTGLRRKTTGAAMVGWAAQLGQQVGCRR